MHQDTRRRLISYKPQEPRLFGPTLQDDLQAMAGLRGTQALLLTGLQKAFHQGELRRDQRIDAAHGAQLSGGQKQIVALASSLAQDSSLYLLDEPTAGVDAETEAALVHAIDTMTQNRSVVLATHSPALLKIVDRILVLERGKIFTSGTPAQLLGAEAVTRTGKSA